jgi:hypothetical protein
MGLIAQNQQTPFTSPSNGDSPIDADTVKGNDNSLTAKHNTHDADATVHVQTGLLSARPAASTPYAMYLDENKRLYVDNGAAWAEVPYARLDAAGTNAFTNNVTVGGTLGVTGLVTTGNIDVLDVDAADIVADSYTGGPIAVTGNSTVTGTLTGMTALGVSGTATATTFAGSGASLTSLPAAQLSGTASAINGSNITALNATALASGTVNNNRLPTNPEFNSVKALQFFHPTSGVQYETAPGATTLISADGAIPLGSLGFINATAPAASSTTYLRVNFGLLTYKIKLESEV